MSSNKIYPAVENEKRRRRSSRFVEDDDHTTVLTVWKRSSMSFQGTDGFTVFDDKGRLVFRVDNYTRNNRSTLLLMDGHGTPLLTIKPPQLFSIQHQWTAYRGGEEDEHHRAFTMRRPSSSSRTRTRTRNNHACEALVFLGTTATPDLKAIGSFRMRNCKITTAGSPQLVATISRKRISTTLLLSDDVFTLTVQPGFQPDLVMAFVVILDRICYKSFTPFLCS